MVKRVLISLLCIAWGVGAIADVPDWPGHAEKRVKPDRGYWFYEDPAKKKKKKAAERGTVPTARAPLGPLPPYKQLLDAHPQDLRKIFTERLEEAVWRPTPQNVYAFMLVKDVSRRKALAVTQMHSYMLLRYPQLNMNSVRAVSTFARDTEVKRREAAVGRALKRERRSYALVYFRSEGCAFCREQDAALKMFRVRTGWQVREVDVDRHPALAKRMNISITPSIILIRRGSDDYMPVAVGATAATELEGNIYRAMRLLRGDVTPQQFFMYEFDKGGLMDPSGDPTDGMQMTESADAQ